MEILRRNGDQQEPIQMGSAIEGKILALLGGLVAS